MGPQVQQLPTHADFLDHMDQVRDALKDRWKWVIHATRDENLPGIRSQGLTPKPVLAKTPDEVRNKFSECASILLLHPLGAKLCPHPATDPSLVRGVDPPSIISLAAGIDDLPNQVGLDWSYCWECAKKYIQEHPDLSIGQLTARLTDKYGSIAVYERMPPRVLRVYCRGDAPADPLGWKGLSEVKDNEIVRHY